ncbi:hypothetical protein [Euzebya pacifica]|nr:hypothetical protein [Euzebya pacifica]
MSRSSLRLLILLAVVVSLMPGAPTWASNGPDLPDDPYLDQQYGLELHRVAGAWSTADGSG